MGAHDDDVSIPIEVQKKKSSQIMLYKNVKDRLDVMIKKEEEVFYNNMQRKIKYSYSDLISGLLDFYEEISTGSIALRGRKSKFKTQEKEQS